MNSSYFNSYDGKKIFLHKWDDVSNPIGVVQIFHGMAEHGGRYDTFAKYLNERGYIVYADDHRGHGKTADSIEKLGYIGDNGFDSIVEDEYFITKEIKSKYPSLPIFIFAHSFGSFIGQEYINRYSNEVNGVILSGSAKRDGLGIDIGLAVTKLFRKFGDESKNNNFIETIIFGNYNKKIKDNTSKNAWLSSDKKQVEKFDNDEYCGAVFTTNFYYNLFSGCKGLYLSEKTTKINKSLPIFIIAGEMDPVGNYGKLVKKLFNHYKNLNISNLKMKLYPKGRHELTNEVNNLEVFDDILKWINSNNLITVE